MQAEIITSGTELLLGEIVDSNTPYLSKKLAEIGVNVYNQVTVGDNRKRLLDTIRVAERRAKIIIISGGLGPTQDDITKQVLADHLKVKLIPDEESLNKIKSRYPNEKISKGNYQQSLVLENSLALKNEVGMAAGIYLEKNNRVYILLPGPPNEFELMVNNYVIPKLVQLTHGDSILRSRILNFYGLGESAIAEKLDVLIDQQNNPTIAIYAKEGIIDVRLTANGNGEIECAELLDDTENKILSLLSSYFIGYGNTKIEDILGNYLMNHEQTMAMTEINLKETFIGHLTNSTQLKKYIKIGLCFSKYNNAYSYFGVATGINNKKDQTKIISRKLKSEFGTHYGVAIISEGSVDNNDYKIYISIAKEKEGVITELLDFSNRTYFPPWLVQLKVSDFLKKVIVK